MRLRQRSSNVQLIQESQQNALQEISAKDIELTHKEISFIMQFGNYYPGFSPEWELFR
jgi:hypothetical protein